MQKGTTKHTERNRGSPQPDSCFSHNQVPGDLKCCDEGAQLHLLTGACSQSVLDVCHLDQQLDADRGWEINSVHEEVDLGEDVLQSQALQCLQLHDFAVGGGELLVEHPVEDVGDVGLEGVSCARVDVLLRHFPEGHGGALQDVEGSAHVTAREGHQRLHPVLTHVHPLLLDDVLQPRHHQLWGEGPEAKAGAAGLQRGDDLGEVVADEAEARVLGELLNHSPQGVLCVLCHGISFIQDDELEAFLEDGPGAGKAQDGPSHDIDAAVIRCIQLQHHGAELPLAVELPCASQDGGGLPGAGGAIEQEVGQPVLTDEPLDGAEDVPVRHQLRQRPRTVLLHPRQVPPARPSF